MINSKNILICPLEWGLGHACRMIPVAKRLHEMNNNIFIGAGENLLLLFKYELPGLKYIPFPGFRMKYSGHLPQYLVVFLKIPSIIYHVIREHYRLKRIIIEHSIDIVISDNRFGLWNKNTKSVYVTHMPRIPFPAFFRFMEPIGVLLHRYIIKKYSICLIPDLPGELNVAGRLSHNVILPGNVRYVGILSRFIGINPAGSIITEKPDYCAVLLSGPEPQKEIFKQKVTKILIRKSRPAIIFEGKPEKTIKVYESQNIVYYNHLTASEMKKLILGCKSIIIRPGYTSVMELLSLNRSALLVPTPGQTEQEYLASYLSEKGWFTSTPQKNINQDTDISGGEGNWPPEIMKESLELLDKALKELLEDKHTEI